MLSLGFQSAFKHWIYWIYFFIIILSKVVRGNWRNCGVVRGIWCDMRTGQPLFIVRWTTVIWRLCCSALSHILSSRNYGSSDVWQYILGVTSWMYVAFLFVSFHCRHPSRCQSPACCHEWLMGLADPIFCFALMPFVLLELILTWVCEIGMLYMLSCKLLLDDVDFTSLVRVCFWSLEFWTMVL